MTPPRRRWPDSPHEDRLSQAGRRAELGAWYTPARMVDGLLGLALDPLLAARTGDIAALRAMRVVDPSCGDGRFLVAAASRIATALQADGVSGSEAWTDAARCVIGVDRDPEAADLARRALSDVVVDGGGTPPERPWVIVDDAIAMDEPPWALSTRAPSLGPLAMAYRGARWDELVESDVGFDLVVGNPPFKGQLKGATRAASQERQAWRQRFGHLVSAFTDVAAYFLLLGEQLARTDRGAVAFVLPIPLLATRDGAAIRCHVLSRAELAHLWVADERTFAARVEVCAAVLVRPPGGAPTGRDGTELESIEGDGEATGVIGAEAASGRTRLWSRLSFLSGPSTLAPSAGSATWSGPLAAHFGVPERRLAVDGVLSDRASATAGFRDQYYGLTGCVVDQEDASPGRSEPPLVTSGAIDPARLGWGHTSIRFQKVERLHPRVQVDRLDGAMQRWVRQQLRPKVLVSTQTRVLEAIADPEGALLPSVPLVSIYATERDPNELDRIGALLTSPPITMLANRRHAGSGLGGRSLRLSAGDLLAMPAPADVAQWDVAAASFRTASDAIDGEERHVALVACGRAMNEAFGLGPDVELLRWWMARLPGRVERLDHPEPG